MGVDPTVSQREIGTGGLVSIVSYSRPSLMIIASRTQFQPGEGPSRGLLRDYEPSDGPSSSSVVTVQFQKQLSLVCSWVATSECAVSPSWH